MHLLEVLIFVLSLVMIGLLITKKNIKNIYVLSLPIITILVIILHFLIDGTRWQMYALYIAVIIIIVLLYLKIFKQDHIKQFIKRILIVFLSLFMFISLLSVIVFPIYEIPSPTGDYLIGTESFVIEDQNRYELYSDQSNEFRKIKIQIWYPAQMVEGYQRAPWLEDGQVVARALSKDTGLPFFVLDHAANIMSNAYHMAPISLDLNEYPVIVISHGWRGFRNLHTDMAEELASLGYIVIGIDHTYGSVATVFSDEDIAYLNLDALPPRETTPDFIDYANQLVNTYALDISTTLDYLEELNDVSSTSRFSGKFDLTEIGLLGHSTGGGADVAIAIDDDRIDALIGLDAWVEPIDDEEINQGLSIPSLFLRSGSWETGLNNTNLYALIESSTYPSEFYQIDGTTHYDFAMVYMYSPLTRYIGFTGSVESRYLNTILKSMISDFFNENLRNDSNSEIDANQWDEVRMINLQ
ncbi:MAG: dienelactone hydrolase family protein [Acholeplasmataceae bacterium]|nr:dienelactone hydrolase family protein [Acholeplasmataceae bacterium]